MENLYRKAKSGSSLGRGRKDRLSISPERRKKGPLPVRENEGF